MATFVLAFGVLLLIVLGMSIGVIFRQKPITGSCGGLNAISDADHCVVCKQSIDPNSPLREKFECPRKKARREALERQQA
ncbi:MAG: (Na+)-NQR maturation NqrM [Cohaesibacteraceae bacterium]|nr:(Na+)-NQR maturation NqrM [Cohaesibacteraceae bacterium]MBL4875021.1 (Na+)-NQR maturation NqrM [Cohaesibacteraceae bacterium]